MAQSVTVDTTLRFKWKVCLQCTFYLFAQWTFSVQDDRITVNLSALATGKDYVYVDGTATDMIWIPDIIIDKVGVTLR